VAPRRPERRARGVVIPVRGPRHVMLTTDAVGGVWHYTLLLAGELGRRGIATTAAVMGPSPTPGQRADARHAGVTLVDRPYRLEWMDDPWSDVDAAGDWLLSLERECRPDVIHLGGYTHAALPWRAPVLVVAHSCVRSWWRAVRGEAAPPAVDRYTQKVRAGLAAADAVIAPSAAMAATLVVEYGVGADARTIPNGVGVPPAHGGSAGASATPPHVAIRETPHARKEPLLLSAGRVWDEAKNIRAVCAVAARLPWPVYVAGDPHVPEGLTGAACPIDHVTTLGVVPPADLARWYARAAIYVLPARYEPFGLSILEAARAGCALVLGDIPSLRENWTDAAVFVPPDDRDALAAAITRLIETPAERTRLGWRAGVRARRFTAARMADAYLAAYGGLLS